MIRKKVVLSVFSAIALGSLICVPVISVGNRTFIRAQTNDPADGYHIVMNADVNKPKFEGSECTDFIVKTKERGNDVLFDFSDAAQGGLNQLVSLKANGYIANNIRPSLKDKNKISGIKTIKVSYESSQPMKLKVKWGPENVANKGTGNVIEVPNGQELVLVGNPSYIQLNAVTDTVVKSIDINYSCQAALNYNVDVNKVDCDTSNAITEMDIKNGDTKFVFPKYFANKTVTGIEEYSSYGESFFPYSMKKIYFPSTYTEFSHAFISRHIDNWYGSDTLRVCFEGSKPYSFDTFNYKIAIEENVPLETFDPPQYVTTSGFVYSIIGESAEIYNYAGNETYLNVPSTINHEGKDYPVSFISEKLCMTDTVAKPNLKYIYFNKEVVSKMEMINMGDYIVLLEDEVIPENIAYYSYVVPGIKNTQARLVDGYTILDRVDGGVTALKYEGDVTELTIPATLDGKNLVSIGPWFLKDNQTITSIVIEAKLKKIPRSAFNGNAFTSITLPDTLEAIDPRGLENNGNLTSLTLPNSMKVLGHSVVKGCGSLNNIYLNDGLESIGQTCFVNTSISDIFIPATVKNIDSMIFYTSRCESINVRLGVSQEFADSNYNSSWSTTNSAEFPMTILYNQTR